MENKRLFSRRKLKASSVMLSSTAIRDNMEVKVDLTSNGLEEKSTSGVSCIFFDFDVKYSFSLSPPLVKFEKE